jgi:hypothetical protein
VGALHCVAPEASQSISLPQLALAVSICADGGAPCLERHSIVIVQLGWSRGLLGLGLHHGLLLQSNCSRRDGSSSSNVTERLRALFERRNCGRARRNVAVAVNACRATDKILRLRIPHSNAGVPHLLHHSRT